MWTEYLRTGKKSTKVAKEGIEQATYPKELGASPQLSFPQLSTALLSCCCDDGEIAQRYLRR